MATTAHQQADTHQGRVRDWQDFQKRLADLNDRVQSIPDRDDPLAKELVKDFRIVQLSMYRSPYKEDLINEYKELKRELGQREYLYPRWVGAFNNDLTQKESDKRLKRLRGAIKSLEYLLKALYCVEMVQGGKVKEKNLFDAQ